MNDDGTLTLAIGNLELTAFQEERLRSICETSAAAARKAQGYPQQTSNSFDVSRQMPQTRSWMWWRVCAMKSYEHDYSWRAELPNEPLWIKSNKTLGVFETQVEQHYVEISRTMLKSHRFFTYKKEGLEDAKEPIELVQRRLQYRSKATDLRNKMDDAVIKSMLCGEAIIKPSLVAGSRPVQQTTKVLMLPDGSPLKRTDGALVPVDAEWSSGEDGSKVLRHDPKVMIPPNIILTPSSKTHKLWHSEPFNDGSRFDVLDHRDCIIDPRWADLDEADYRGFEFSWTLDQIREYLSGGWTICDKAFELYVQACKNIGSERVSAAKTSRMELGESEQETTASTRMPHTEETQPLILLCEEYVSADILGLGSRQDLFIIRDVQRNIPICYTFAKDTLPWLKGNPRHGLIVMKSGKVADRWYGSGYFKDMYDDSMTVDELKNQSRLEMMWSGNVCFMQPKMIKNVQMGEDGRGNGVLRVRGDTPNELVPGATMEEAFQVTPIVPQVGEINEQMDFELTRIRGRWGQITPGSDQGLEGANTAFGMNMIAEKSNAHLNARQKVISDGLDKCIEVFSRIELLNIDLVDLVNQLGKDNAELVMQFITTNKDDFTDAIQTMLANANAMTALQGNMQAIQLAGEFYAILDPRVQEIVRPLYVKALLGLDIDDPETFLKTYEELAILAQAKALAQQAATGVDPNAPAGTGGVAAGNPAAAPKPRPGAAEGQTPPPAPANSVATSSKPPRQPTRPAGSSNLP